MLSLDLLWASSIHAHDLNRSALDAGNYDTYLQVRSELEDAQMKKHKWEQDQISHMKVQAFHLAPLLNHAILECSDSQRRHALLPCV